MNEETIQVVTVNRGFILAFERRDGNREYCGRDNYWSRNKNVVLPFRHAKDAMKAKNIEEKRDNEF